MLLFYINENGEICSTKDKDLVVQTSRGVDTIVVDLPQDYDDTNIIASITFKNAKNVNSSSYTMAHIVGSKRLTFKLNHAWFSSVRGLMQFTIRVYSTNTSKNDYVEIDNATGDIIVRDESSIQVFTKGSYNVLEAIETGETPKIPTQDLDLLYEQIGGKSSVEYVNNSILKVVGISPNDIEANYKTINDRVKTLEDNSISVSQVEQKAQQIYDANDKVVKIENSDKALTITSTSSISGSKDVQLSLPSNAILVEYGEDFDLPITTIDNALLLGGKKEEDLKVRSANYYIDRNGDERKIEDRFDTAFFEISKYYSIAIDNKSNISNLSSKVTTNTNDLNSILPIFNYSYLLHLTYELGGEQLDLNIPLASVDTYKCYHKLYSRNQVALVYVEFNGGELTFEPIETNQYQVTLIAYNVLKLKDL